MIEGFALQAGSYSAETLRRATMGIMLERGSSIGSVVGGLVASTDLQTKAGTGMHVETSPGECIVNQGYSTSGGPNYMRLTSTLTSNVPAASPTLPRVDLICAQVDDAAYHGSLNEYVISYLEGTPTSGANLTNKNGAPTLPTSSLALAYILVPANATSLTNEDVENVGKALLLGHGVTANAILETMIAGEAVTNGKVKKGTLTGDKLAVSSAKYSIVEAPGIGTEYEPSATRPALVVLQVLRASSTASSVAAYVGTTKVGEAVVTGAGESARGSCITFLCPAGAKWHYTSEGTGGGTAQAAYIVF